jgi:plasmid replication initiation protein
MSDSKLPIARIDNTFVYNARYQLSAREAKVMLYLISKIDPIKQSQLNEQTISVKELEAILKGDGKKWGGLYEEMRTFQDRMMGRTITMPTDIEIDGKSFPGKMNWFQYISPVRMDDGTIGMRFLFSQPLQPALLNLKEYVGVELLEVIPLKSSFSIRMFQIFRAHRNRLAKYQKKSHLRYEIEELKSLLGVDQKYEDYGNLKKRVLQPLETEISQHTSIKVTWKGIKKGRNVEEIEFEFWDKGSRQAPTHQKDLFDGLKFEDMAYAQVKAFDRLVAYSVQDNIAIEMIGRVVGASEVVGFEDWYFEEVIKIFESKTQQVEEDAKAGTIVNWFLKKKIFEQDDHFATIMERLNLRKKDLQNKSPESWDNRLLAKNITAQAFLKTLKSKK